MMAKEFGVLSYARRGDQVRAVPLQVGTMTIGRRPDNDLTLDAEEVAPYHASLHCTAEGCWVTDLDSATGTTVNLARLKPNTRHQLHDGDILQIGPFFLRYTHASRPANTQIVPPTAAAKVPTPTAQAPTPPIRRLRGSSGPPRIPPGRRRITTEVSSYLHYLPPIYHDNNFLGRFLLIFESILGPIERIIDHIQCYFDARITPEMMLPWLASWVGLALNENLSIEKRRRLIGCAARLYRWRGTRTGLSEFLRIYAEVDPLIIEPGREAAYGEPSLPPHVFKVILEVPDPTQLDRSLVEQIIETQKPAHTGYRLDIRHRP